MSAEDNEDGRARGENSDTDMKKFLADLQREVNQDQDDLVNSLNALADKKHNELLDDLAKDEPDPIEREKKKAALESLMNEAEAAEDSIQDEMERSRRPLIGCSVFFTIASLTSALCWRIVA